MSSTSDKRWFLNEEFSAEQYKVRESWPKISIVTPTFNYGHLIEETILSVIRQNYPNLEFIIIDGGSKDDTIEVVERYSKYINYWISEKDTGQPNAINKGLKQCTGEIFNWLNSDDFLEKGALFKIALTFLETSADVVAGGVRYFDSNGFEEVNLNALLSSVGIMCWQKNVNFVQPGVWLKLKNLLAINGVDEDQKMRFAFDWDMMIRYLYFFPNVAYVSDLLVHYRFHPVSNTISDPARYGREEAYIIEKLGGNLQFIGLHPTCQYKIARRSWSEFLWNTGNEKSSRVRKILKIISSLHKQPWENGTPRMTGGAIKQIFKSNMIK